LQRASPSSFNNWCCCSDAVRFPENPRRPARSTLIFVRREDSPENSTDTWPRSWDFEGTGSKDVVSRMRVFVPEHRTTRIPRTTFSPAASESLHAATQGGTILYRLSAEGDSAFSLSRGLAVLGSAQYALQPIYRCAPRSVALSWTGARKASTARPQLPAFGRWPPPKSTSGRSIPLMQADILGEILRSP